MAQDSGHLRSRGGTHDGDAGEAIQRGELLGYGLAVLCVAIATGLALAVRAWNGETILFPFFIAIIIMAWASGPLPAWVATVIAVLVVDYVFTPPYNSFTISLEALPNFIGFALCLGITCLIVAKKRHSEALVSQVTRLQSEHRMTEIGILREANAALSDQLAQRNDATALAQALLERSALLVLRLDAADRLIDLNPAAARALGIARQAALGQRSLDLLAPAAGHTSLQSRLAEARREPSAMDLGLWSAPGDGRRQIRWTSVTLTRAGGEKEVICLGLVVDKATV